MQNTWLASVNNTPKDLFLLFWYYKFLLHSKFLPFTTPLPNKLRLLTITLKLKPLVFPRSRPEMTTKFSSYLTSNVLAHQTKAPLIKDLSLWSKKAQKFSLPKKTLHQTLHLFFVVNQNSDFQQFKPHANFRLFFLQQLPDRQFLFKPAVFMRKWQNIYAFLYNSFYYNHTPLVFSSKFFKKETLSLNWFFHPLSLRAWRYSSFFFTFLITIYSRKLGFFYKKLKHRGVAYALIVDLEYHFKTLFYLRRNNWFTLALVPLNLNPWAVSLAVPIGSNDLFVQFFFFKFLIFARKESLLNQFLLFKKLWFDYRANMSALGA